MQKITKQTKTDKNEENAFIITTAGNLNRESLHQDWEIMTRKIGFSSNRVKQHVFEQR